jgi:hypothetical protein
MKASHHPSAGPFARHEPQAGAIETVAAAAAWDVGKSFTA